MYSRSFFLSFKLIPVSLNSIHFFDLFFYFLSSSSIVFFSFIHMFSSFFPFFLVTTFIYFIHSFKFFSTYSFYTFILPLVFTAFTYFRNSFWFLFYSFLFILGLYTYSAYVKSLKLLFRHLEHFCDSLLKFISFTLHFRFNFHQFWCFSNQLSFWSLYIDPKKTPKNWLTTPTTTASVDAAASPRRFPRRFRRLPVPVHSSQALNWKKIEKREEILSQNSIKKFGLGIFSEFIFESDSALSQVKRYDPHVKIFIPLVNFRLKL